MNSNRILNILDGASQTTIPLELSNYIDRSEEFDVYNYTLSMRDDSPSEKEKLNIGMLSCAETFSQELRELNEIVNKFKPKICHTHHTRGTLLILLSRIKNSFMFKSQSYKWLHTVHNDYGHYSLKQKVVFLLAYLVCDKIICNSKNSLDSLPSFEAIKNKSVVAYNGVNIERVQRFAFSDDSTSRRKEILFVGRLVRQKNVPTLLRAFSQISSKIPEYTLVICGDGPLQAELVQLGDELNISDRVRFLGFVTREEVYKKMHCSKILVTPSSWEGFCNVNVEAMAAGLAVIASDIKINTEIVEGGGKFFSLVDYESLSKELLCLLDDEEKIRKMSLKGMERAKLFSIENAAFRYKQEYIYSLQDV